ncbi:carbohydrate ABC transporter permease [Candidatus Izemoplasma sp. B36]|uniref:carbohydrate ABC transporter permease n=1 Tax=Candidatus Izemoplasma sp. B36 TaxID=3242468 RepID=UPI0035571CFB
MNFTKLRAKIKELNNKIVAYFEKVLKLDTSAKAKRRRKKKFFIFVMLFLPISQFLIFFVYVNIDTILLSFQRYNYISGGYDFVGFDNYKIMLRNIFELPQMKTAIINSLWFFPVTNFITLPLSVIAAYFMFRKVPGRSVFKVLFFLPSIISIVVLTMSFQFMFDPLFGPINILLSKIGIEPIGGWFGNKSTVMPLILLYCIWAGIGFNMVLLNGAISRLPKEVIESARIDGITMFKEFRYIIVPMIWPTITTLFVIGTTAVFTIFLQNLLLANGGPDGASKTIAYLVVEMVRGGNLTDAATLGVIFTIIGIPIILFIKHFMEKIGQEVEY